MDDKRLLTLVNLGLVLANVELCRMTLKLYTEFVKEKKYRQP